MSNEAITKAVETAKAALFECYEELHRLECTYVQTATWDVFVETPAMTKAGEALEALSALQPSPAREEAADKYEAAKRKVWGGAPNAASEILGEKP